MENIGTQEKGRGLRKDVYYYVHELDDIRKVGLVVATKHLLVER